MGKLPDEKGRPSTKTPRRELPDLFEEQRQGPWDWNGVREIGDKSGREKVARSEIQKYFRGREMIN